MNIGKETEFIEFKESTADKDKGIESMSSILNKHGKGTLYFGVKDNGDVKGQTIGDSTLNRLSQDIARDLKPQCRYSVSECVSADGKHFIEVEFSGNRAPYSARGRYFLRFHDEDRQMDNETLRQYYMTQRADYSDWEKADSGCSFKNINEEQLKAYVANAREKGRLVLKYTAADHVLSRLGLMFSDVNLNNAGNVLFSRNGPVRVKLVRFAGATRLTVISLQVFEGNVFECIEASMKFLASNIDWKFILDGDIRRKEEPEIPAEAYREIIVNAFSHGDYDTGTDFELDVYSDRVSIYSPGMFPKPYTPEDYANKGLEPIPLNITISDILFRNGTIEQVSTGFERTFAACRAKKVRYEYAETSTGFRFTFLRNGVAVRKEVPSTEQKIVDLLKDDPFMTVQELAEKCGVTSRTVQRYIKKMKEARLLKQIKEADGTSRNIMS